LAKALPYTDEWVSVRREGQLVRVSGTSGLQVELYTASRNWRVLAPGSLHGSVNGLLGSNNYHRNDDYFFANGTTALSNGDRLKSWSTGGSCSVSSTNALFPKDLSYSTLAEENCARLFTSPTSHLSRCHFAVDPEPYNQLCKYAMKNRADVADQHMCSLERAYVTACQAMSVNVRVQPLCVDCAGYRRKGIKDVITEATSPSKDRYIFLVEDAACLSNAKDFMSKLADGLSTNAVDKTTFSLMQFNADSVHTVAMANGDLNGTASAFKDALSRIFISQPSVTPLRSSEEGNANSTASSSTALRVLYEAITMATPPGYRDHVLLFACSSCGADPKYSYARMQSLLQQHGIALHYFTKANFIVPGVGDGHGAVGMDQNTLFFVASAGGVETVIRDRSWRPPKDACSPLAMQSDGSIWKMRDATIALAYINRRIKWNKTLTSYQQKCVCRPDKYGNGEVECQHPLKTN
jgi:hypothetical protein